MADVYQVTAGAVVVPVGTTEQYLYRGAVLPDAVDREARDRLVDIGLVAKVPEGSPVDVPEVPRKSAAATTWTAYAIGQGMAPDVVARATKAELVAHYLEGGPLPGTEPDKEDEPPAGDVPPDDD